MVTITVTDDVTQVKLSETDTAHRADTGNPHSVTAAQVGAPTTATFNDHSARHENGGADEISVAGLSGLLADSQTPLAHDLAGAEHNATTLAALNLKISDATLDSSSGSRTPTAHDIAGALHNASTLAALNTKVSDATLDDSSASRTPTAHDLAGALHNSATLAAINAKISDDDLVGLAATQTLTNKTLTSPAISGPTVSGNLVVSSGGRVIAGNATAVSSGAGSSALQVLNGSGDPAGMLIGNWSFSASASFFNFIKSRSGTIGSSTILQDGDDVGGFIWWGDDGTDFATPVAQVIARIDGTPGVDDMPGELLFRTTADGAAAVTTRMRISSGGVIEASADIVPEADGTRDLGVQTTAQWANVWADLVNGADIGFLNGWRAIEADTYQGYSAGIAFDFGAHFETGKAAAIRRVKTGTRQKEVGADGKGNPVFETVDVFDRQRVTDLPQTPHFAVTQDFLEFAGRRLTPAVLDALLALVQ